MRVQERRVWAFSLGIIPVGSMIVVLQLMFLPLTVAAGSVFGILIWLFITLFTAALIVAGVVNIKDLTSRRDT